MFRELTADEERCKSLEKEAKKLIPIIQERVAKLEKLSGLLLNTSDKLIENKFYFIQECGLNSAIDKTFEMRNFLIAMYDKLSDVAYMGLCDTFGELEWVKDPSRLAELQKKVDNKLSTSQQILDAVKEYFPKTDINFDDDYSVEDLCDIILGKQKKYDSTEQQEIIVEVPQLEETVSEEVVDEVTIDAEIIDVTAEAAVKENIEEIVNEVVVDAEIVDATIEVAAEETVEEVVEATIVQETKSAKQAFLERMHNFSSEYLQAKKTKFVKTAKKTYDNIKETATVLYESIASYMMPGNIMRSKPSF